MEYGDQGVDALSNSILIPTKMAERLQGAIARRLLPAAVLQRIN